MIRRSSIVIFCLSLIGIVHCYSSGAPLSDEICTSLRPNHPGDPQTVRFPYKLRLNKRVASPGETITLSITARRQAIRGFLVQGRKENFEKETTPIGSFVTTGRENELQTIDCQGLENSAVTHRNGEEKRNVTIEWEAPKEEGTYILLTTVVESGKVYWVGYPSPTLMVNDNYPKSQSQ